MTRKKAKPMRWDEPPPGAIDWLRLCIAWAKETADKREREDFERQSERYGVENARAWRREGRSDNRKLHLLLAAYWRLPVEEEQALMDWWQERVIDELPPECTVTGLAPEASPVQCNGDANTRRSAGGESPGADDPEGR